MPADQATIHEFLVEQLSALKAQLIDFAFKHGTVVCLLLGWILSSEQAQRFYAASLWIRALTSVGLAVYAALYVYWVRANYKHSERIFKHLQDLGYMEPRYFDFLTVRRRLASSFIALHVMLCGGMITFIWLIPVYQSSLLHCAQATGR